MAKRRRKISAEGNGADQPKRGNRPPVKLALPPSQGTALRLLEDLQKGRITPGDLTPKQRRACLLVAADGKRTSTELAALFQVRPSTIRRDMQKIRAEIGSEYSEWGLNEVIGDLALAKERCVQGALKQDDFGLAWTIHREFAKTLIDTGVVKRKDQAEGFELTLRAVGSRYEEAVQVLAQGGGFDPKLAGVVQPEGLPGGKARSKSPVALPFGEATPDQEGEVVDVPVRVLREGERTQGEERIPRRGVDQEDWPDLEPE